MTSCQASLDSEGWFNTWSAEWQARQLLLIASDPGPAGNIVSLLGTSSFSGFNVVIVAAWARWGNSTRPSNASTGEHRVAAGDIQLQRLQCGDRCGLAEMRQQNETENGDHRQNCT